MIELYWGSGSPWAWRVMLALAVKGVEYESRLLSFSEGDHKADGFLALNPRGQVPCLRDGDVCVYESLAIVAYLDRRFPEPPLLGRTPAESGRVFQTILEFEHHGVPVINDRVTRRIFRGQAVDYAEEIREAAPAARAELARLDARLDGREWLVGDAVSAADLGVYPHLQLLLRALGKPDARDLDLGLTPFDTVFPALAAWCRRVEALPGYDATYPPHWREAP
ncbi:MAG: glutathione S-transferase family protein [Deltaproteobacteria bacterium]|nr:glutathione S-transferase family protein [Deltaproteobacteria bacterium]